MLLSFVDIGLCHEEISQNIFYAPNGANVRKILILLPNITQINRALLVNDINDTAEFC